ncbi:hypothetical protein FRACYDRAFT_233438 [Fragilariopsis cylindrus CCMP1102]|uniref:Uncharacterized protein n=1 Tax=Fragilariopsis cylindrus CCMP1102 TaxID=635003 RepID=A0A1E7FYP9_9STRA|nr:hypothetical protein FRACYDRAFT_233438 [Fragilariopsis cylindrus CCMP1102]|eukprot:OEU23266.1 hypothetical protein FRACYDRAFT_233438 [Fragilariopsis cylindrus CCMP1102]
MVNFLSGFRAVGVSHSSSSSNSTSTQKQKQSRDNITITSSSDHQDQDDLSIVSIYRSPDRLQQQQSSMKITTTKDKYNNKGGRSSARSVMSEVTLPNGFLPAKNERVYVPSIQGKLIKSRCKHFRVLLRSGGGVIYVDKKTTEDNSLDDTYASNSASNSTAVDDSKKDLSAAATKKKPTPPTTIITTKTTNNNNNNNRILTKEAWSSRTTRHIIELLTEGTTWIENNVCRFAELCNACEEINVRLCLGSLINYHDIIDRASTYRFFQLRDINKYQFKIIGTIKSWQWMNLLQRGILLLCKTNVLMLTIAPPNDGTGHLPMSATSSKIVTKVNTSAQQPQQQRLLKCDDLYTEFCVYSEKSKINVLYTILDLFSISNNDNESEGKSKSSTRLSRSTSIGDGNNTTRPQLEEFKIIYKTRIGDLHEQDVNMLWRMTSSSYTLSTEDEEDFLRKEDEEEVNSNEEAMAHHPQDSISHSHDMNDNDNDNANESRNIRRMSIGDDSETEASTSSEGTFADETIVEKENKNNDDNDTESRSSRSNSNGSSNISHESHTGSTTSPHATMTLSPPPVNRKSKFQYRTITTTSFMVLKHLFEPMNSLSKGDSSSSGGAAKFNLSLLPACILVSNPTPDTLGRFLNASAAVANGNISDGSINEVGWDILPPSPTTTNGQSTVFFVSNTSQYVQGIVDYMADYSNTSVVGESDFTLKQHV